MPPLKLEDGFSNRKLRPVILAWAKRTQAMDSTNFMFDVQDHKSPEHMYEMYFAKGAKYEVNLPSVEVMKPMRTLAQQGAAGYKQMGPVLLKARFEMVKFFRNTFEQGINSFQNSEEYKKFLSGGVETNPVEEKILAALALSGSKAQTFLGLFQVFQKARTMGDAVEAYLAMQKIVAKSKLDPALRESGGKSMADLEAEVAKVKNVALAAKLVPTAKSELTAGKTFLDTAIKTVKRKGRVSNPREASRIFQTARSRVEKATAAYLQAVRLDSNFNMKYPTVAKEKKAVDDMWVEYRKLLGVGTS